ncbi:MAG: hypothetical protein HDR27_09895 [Lachnospiraceae bacterium]|nr:hypothetical protein [Lachnospiraceae bacterium]
MKMEEFITRAGALMPLPGVRAMTFSSIGSTVMTLDEKYKEADALAEQCNVLITKYKQVYDIISKAAAPGANEKSEIDARLKEYRNQCSGIQGELDNLARETAFYDQKQAEFNQEAARLQEMAREIEKRSKSGNNFIPFYGIKYAVDTRNMYNNYRRKKDQNNVRKRWLDENSASYRANGNRERELQGKKVELTKEMERLRKKFGDAIELLNILNNLIASLGDFIKAVGKRRNALQCSLFESINEAQTAINRTLSMIRSFHDAFRMKLTGISGKLEKDTYNRIVNLTG